MTPTTNVAKVACWCGTTTPAARAAYAAALGGRARLDRALFWVASASFSRGELQRSRLCSATYARALRDISAAERVRIYERVGVELGAHALREVLRWWP